MKPLKAGVHMVIDYAAGILCFLAPALLGFQGTLPATILYIVGGFHLTLSLLTHYPGGVVKWIAFPTHGMIELLAGIALLPMPWIFGFSALTPAMVFYVATGLAIILTWSLTDYQSGRRIPRVMEDPYSLRERRAA